MTRLLLGAREEHGVATPELLRLRFFAWAKRHHIARPLRELSDALVAYVSAGRWLADCPQCGAGIALEREWPEGLCFGCGGLYSAIVWPEDADDIERVLRARPHAATRTWLPKGHRAFDHLPDDDPKRRNGETLADLIIENAERRVALRYETAAERATRKAGEKD